MATSSVLRWTPSQAAYQLRIRPVGAVTWINVPIPPLIPATPYEWELLSNDVIPPVVPVVPVTPPAGVGVKAVRVADIIEPWGYNGFPSDSATANVFGAWPADFSLASVTKSKQYFGDYNFGFRPYFYAGDRAMMEPWGKALYAATGQRSSVTLGANAGLVDATALASMLLASAASDGWIAQVEGSNEPNNKEFGGPGVDPDTVVAIQKTLWAAGQKSKTMAWPVLVAGPSIIAGMPRPEGWIMPLGPNPGPQEKPGFFNAAQLAAIRANMERINGHFYPPGHPDLPSGGRGSWMKDYVAGLKVAYGDMPVSLTEGHPSLFGAHTLDPAYDAYYGLCTLFSCFKAGVKSYYWYALEDFGQKDVTDPATKVVTQVPIYASGLFPQTGGVAPRPVAASFKALAALAADPSANRRTFTPGSLDFTIDGMTPNGDAGDQFLLSQNAGGTFFLDIWRGQDLINGAVSNKTVRFATPVKRATLYKVSDAAAPGKILQDAANASSMTVPLNGAVFHLVIQP